MLTAVAGFAPVGEGARVLVAGAGVSGDLDEAVARLGVRFSFMGDGTPQQPQQRASSGLGAPGRG